MKLNGAIQTEEKKFLRVRINTSILLACIYKEARKLIGYVPAKY